MTPSSLGRRSVAAIAAFLVGAPAAGQAPRDAKGTSADIQDIRYEITFDHVAAASRTVKVSMTFAVGGNAPVILSLPEWTPGAYEISNFARWVSDFVAKADGHDLTWSKQDYDSWRVEPAGAKSVTVSFTYLADSLDNAMAWTQRDFLLFTGTNLFLYPEGRSLGFPARVTVRTEADWRVATGMQAEGANSFRATNYHDLVDMPFFVGRFDIDSAQISGKWVRYVTYPQGSVSGAARLTAWDQLKRVIPPEVAVFGEVPWENYTVMQIADSSYQGASGLEHQSSHVDVVTPVAIGSTFQPSLYAHEIFHAWNVKRLRPAEMWPYEYDRSQPTPWLWVSEGITDYYADLAEVRGGVVDENGFYAATAAKMREVSDTRPVSLDDASIDTWIHPVDGTQYTYYAKGSLAGLLLDIMIRDASDNRQSLDNVMRDLYTNVYKAGRGFTATDWWAAVSKAAGGKSFGDFAARYVEGRESYPWDRVLALAGLHTSRPNAPRLGVYTVADSGGVLVTRVEEGSSAAAAGVREGDYLLTVGDIPVTDEQFGEHFRGKFGNAAEGSPIVVKVRRAGQTLSLTGKLRFAPGDIVLEADTKAGAKAVRIRNGIVRGK
ncbi:MAG TPA: PDZ domain-containing protein [Gemmatimonadaceae bacterium]|jgi:predicted metalloprotease with PDZ domain